MVNRRSASNAPFVDADSRPILLMTRASMTAACSRGLLAFAAIATSSTGCVTSVSPLIRPTISAKHMQQTVSFLATKEMRGRRVGSPENARAAEWIARQFSDLGLSPAVEGSFFHEFPYGRLKGRNVAGIVEATGVDGSGKAAEFVVVAAHLDGVGDVHRPAADDNASGVAALIEIARAVVAMRSTLRRNVVFVAFDAEEVGLVGSTRFVLDEIILSEDTRFTIVFDMIGGKFFPWEQKTGIAMGTEHSDYIRSIVERLRLNRATPIELLGTYVLEPAEPLLARSDYRAYRKAEIPYVFFSTGTPWYYHMAQDSIDRVDFQQSEEIATFALDLLLEIACNACEIDFIKRPKPGVLDLVQLHRILEELLQHQTEIQLPERKFTQIGKMKQALASSIANKKASRILAQRGPDADLRSRPTLRAEVSAALFAKG